MAENSKTSAPGERPPPSAVAHPHDRYFRAELAGRAEQAALVADLFPALAPLLAADTFETVRETFVDENLRQRQTDLLLKVSLTGQDVYVYLLIEHQRSVDPLMALRMLRYQTRIWDHYLAQHPDATQVPAILPAVVYQGEGPWTAATDLRDILTLDPETTETLAAYLPSMRYRLDDLTQIDRHTLHARDLTPALRLTLLMLKLAPANPQIADLLDSLAADIIAVAEGPDGPRHLQATFTYIRNVTDVPDDQLLPVIDRLGPTIQEAFMTNADTLIAKGREQGIEEGETKGRAEVLLHQLAFKFAPLPDSVQTRVHAATTSQLEDWALRVLTATTLDDVFN